jgi:hypothetical protein
MTTAGQRFRYPAEGRWFKGNTHIHTSRSDGGLDVEQTVTRYGRAGYDFVFLTDHWHASSEPPAARSGPPLVLDGVEIDGTDRRGSYYHVACLGRFEGITRGTSFESALHSCREQGGLLILAHPSWTGNTVEDALAHPFHGVETYNHVCTWLNGKGHALHHWDCMLSSRPSTLGFAADDSHNRPEHPGWDGGWIMVRATECSAESLMSALRAGAFYSTQGPELLDISLAGDTLTVRSSPVRFARLAGPASLGDRVGDFTGAEMDEFSFSLDPSWDYIRLEVEDSQGQRAWSNALFV